MIKHSDMLRRMEHGEVFTLQYVKYDRRRKTGGELVTLENCRKHQAGRTNTGQARPEGAIPAQRIEKWNPNHTVNGTINIKTNGGHIKKVHTRLIVKFNQQEVAL